MKRTFWLIRRQGGGCDYTIGCGWAVDSFEAYDYADALAQMQESAIGCEADDEYGFTEIHERELEMAWIVDATEARELPIDAWRKTKDAREGAAAASEAETAERAEYERLRAKFEKPAGVTAAGEIVFTQGYEVVAVAAGASVGTGASIRGRRGW